jgi:hypothetical protein
MKDECNNSHSVMGKEDYSLSFNQKINEINETIDSLMRTPKLSPACNDSLKANTSAFCSKMQKKTSPIVQGKVQMKPFQAIDSKNI